MIQRREHFRFALKAREPIGISGERRRQDLDRDLTFQPGVRRPIHLAHPAFADLGGDFVDAETGAGSEGQSWRDYTGGIRAWMPRRPLVRGCWCSLRGDDCPNRPNRRGAGGR